MAAHNRLELAGKRFGRLVVTAFAGTGLLPNGDHKSKWSCVCDCGTEIVVFGSSLTTSNTTSCGCFRTEAQARRSTSHGMTGSRTYRIWQAMLNRCRNTNIPNFARYGGRGIRVCPEWEKFERFHADMGDAPPGMSIDRIDNNGNYEPGNCRWASRFTQARNKSTNRVIQFNGQSMCLKQWAERLGMDQASLAERIQRWGLERALTTPKGKRNVVPQSMQLHR